MGRTTHIQLLQDTCKKEMLELMVMLRDNAIPEEKKKNARIKLLDLENLILAEVDEVRGSTEVRRKALRDSLEAETKKRTDGGTHA